MEQSHRIEIRESLESISEEIWSPLCPPDFPFFDLAFLRAFEETGAVGTQAGWQPFHITAWKDNHLEGACPLYLKNHSYGEYIFDWGWASAYQEHGLAYYPKLVAAVPFTPATGPKLLGQSESVRSLLVKVAREMVPRLKASSLHYLFLTEEELPLFEKAGFLIRHSFQYHWRNRSYGSFGNFLDAFRAPKRKQIRKERREVQGQGLEISIVTGEELTEEYAEIFHRFYLSTIEKMSAIAYLDLAFFQRIFACRSIKTVLFLARKQGAVVAGSLCFEKGDRLYGRYWGATEAFRALHFELCYYRPIEYAIARGLTCFEAGAQGEHKLARGFEPVLTYSAHWIEHPGFRSAIARFIEEEKRGIQAYFLDLATHSPLK